MNPLVSIVIPCYNAASWLGETLLSASSQTWPYKEIILVDDGSSDKSLEIAHSVSLACPLKILRQAHQGASAARNLALQHAEGDYLQYLDADDLLAPNKIEKQIALLQKYDQPLLCSARWGRFHKNPKRAFFKPDALWQTLSPVQWLTTALDKNLMMHPAAWLTHRSLIQKAGPWNESLPLNFNDDGEYFARVMLESPQILHCPDAVSFYRSANISSYCHTQSPQAYQSVFSSLELICNHLLAKENSKETRQACANAFQRFSYEVFPFDQDLFHSARKQASDRGGSNLQPLGGPAFKILSKLLGWKTARKLQSTVYRLGYQSLRLKLKYK